MSATDEHGGEVERIGVIVSGAVPVDPDNLARWCREWSTALAIDVELSFVADHAATLRRMTEMVRRGVGGLVLCPADRCANRWCGSVPALVPHVWVDLGAAERPRPGFLPASGMSIRGRGIDGFRWAMRLLRQRLSWPYLTVPYGAGLDQVGDLRLPAALSARAPVAVLLHGGFWRERWERDTIEPLAIDLARRGYATWNLEYRRVGPFGGGWPATCVDVAAGLDHLAVVAEEHPLDLGRVVVVGHSAGGQLALWCARRLGVDGYALVSPSLIVALAGMGDLAECARRGIGDTGNATTAFLGGMPADRRAEYAAASPREALPLGVRQVVVQGRRDNTADLVDMSRIYVRAARAAGDDVAFVEIDEADHFDLIDPASAAWATVADTIEHLLEVPRA